MRWQTLLPLAACAVTSVHAVFSDDAFHTDYHEALLGIPQSHATFFHKPQTSSNASLLYTISDKAVLGAVNPRDGSVVWRQSLAPQPLDNAPESFLIAGEADGRVTSALGPIVSSWDALDGRLVWTYNTSLVVKDLQAIPTVGGSAENVVQDVVVVAGPVDEGSTANVIRLGGDGSGTKWAFQDSSTNKDNHLSVATSASHVFYIATSKGLLSSGKAKVVVLDIETGKEVSQYNTAVDSESLGNVPSVVTGSGTGAAILLSSEKPYKSAKLNLLGNTKGASITIDDKGEEIQQLTVHYPNVAGADPHFLIHVHGKERHWAEIFHINKKSGDASKAYSLPATKEISTFAASTVGSTVYFTRVTESEVSLYSSASHGQIGRWQRTPQKPQSQRSVLHAVAEVSSRGANNIALRIGLSCSKSGWSLIRNGEEMWTRPEMLAYINKAVWSEYAGATSLAQEIEAEASSNPMSAYVRRLRRHLNDLQHLPRYLAGLPDAMLSTGEAQSKTTREKLIGSKFVLASSSRGEVFALDATSKAKVYWNTDLTGILASDASIVHLSSTEDRLTVYSSDGGIVVVNIESGKVVDQQKSAKPFNKIVELPGSLASTVITVSAEGKPEVFTDLAPAEPTEGSVLITLKDNGEAAGWSIGSSIEQIWTLRPENGGRITNVVGRPAHDPIASVGRVLGDRSVLYKYVNPNVALLTAVSSTALTVYLINAITGAILFTASHEGVVSDIPISTITTGNFFAYSFTARDSITSGLSSQIMVSELFESEMPNDRGLLSALTNYSSFSPDAGAQPHVETRAFTVAEPLSHLAVSQTTQGITSRQLLAYLSNSHAIVGFPDGAVNARRPIDRDPTSSEMEEGLVRYAPVLELDPKFYVSHSRDVLGTKQIITTPTLLESTSLVFAYGHDIFGTQLAPSNTFDVLGKGFKRVQLILTVIALYCGVMFIRPLAKKQMVERWWR